MLVGAGVILPEVDSVISSVSKPRSTHLKQSAQMWFLSTPVPVVLPQPRVDAGLIAVDKVRGKEVVLVAKGVETVEAHSVGMLSPDLSQLHVSHLVLTWLSQAAPIADT